MPVWEDVRRLALALPQVEEGGHFGLPAWRVGGKQFAGKSRTGEALIVRLDPEDQSNLSALHPGLVAPVSGGPREAKAGAAGWTSVGLAGSDEALLARLLKLAWLETAPPKLRSVEDQA